MKYSSKSLTNVGKVRSANEDNLGEAKTPNGDLFVVCDGMGGHVGGAQASSIAVNSIIEYFQREVYDNVIQAMDHALSFANEQIYASALNNPDLKGMGTTAVILLVRDEECFIGHVGDSRIYLRSNGKLNRITKDHSFVQTLVDSGVIEDEDAENHPNKNQILQALGIAPTVKATICQSAILPKAGDMFLLCSDGLNGMVNDRDIERIMQEDNLMVTSENLITAALNGGGHDNITASLVLIEESIHTNSRFVHFNPKPKVIDLTSTQQFGGGTETNTPKKSKLPYYIGGSLLLLGACIAAMILLGKEEVTKIEVSCLKINELKSGAGCSGIKLNDSVNVHHDKLTIDCEDVTKTITIEKWKVVKIETIIMKDNVEVNKDVPVQNKMPNVDDKKNRSKNIKDLNEMSLLEIESLKKNDPVNAKEGINKWKSKYYIEVKAGKVIHSTYLYTVQSGDGLEKIRDYCKSKNSALTIQMIQSENEQNPELSETERQQLTDDNPKVPVNRTLRIPIF